MLYGGISAYIMFHSEISAMSASIVFPQENLCFHVACMYYGARSGALRAPELAEQSGLALGSIWKALGSLWEASWKRPDIFRENLLRAVNRQPWLPRRMNRRAIFLIVRAIQAVEIHSFGFASFDFRASLILTSYKCHKILLFA